MAFKFGLSSYDGSVVSVIAHKPNTTSGYDIVMAGPQDKVIKARVYKVPGTSIGQMVDITDMAIGGGGTGGGVVYTLVSEGSGDYSIADTTLTELRTDLATDVKNVELVYPNTYGTATVIGYRMAGAQGEDLIVLRADGKAVSYSVTESGSDLYLQQVTVSKNIFDTSTGVILDATTGTGGTYELDGESIASLTSLAEDGTTVWISWPTYSTDLNLSQVVGWDVQTSSFGMTCIDGQGNYRKLSAVDGTDTVVLTIESERDVGDKEVLPLNVTLSGMSPAILNMDILTLKDILDNNSCQLVLNSTIAQVADCLEVNVVISHSAIVQESNPTLFMTVLTTDRTFYHPKVVVFNGYDDGDNVRLGYDSFNLSYGS